MIVIVFIWTKSIILNLVWIIVGCLCPYLCNMLFQVKCIFLKINHTLNYSLYKEGDIKCIYFSLTVFSSSISLLLLSFFSIIIFIHSFQAIIFFDIWFSASASQNEISNSSLTAFFVCNILLLPLLLTLFIELLQFARSEQGKDWHWFCYESYLNISMIFVNASFLINGLKYSFILQLYIFLLSFQTFFC